MSPALRVALTGGIATGKSHCLARFAALGTPVIDADVLARLAVGKNTAGIAAVAARFGPAVLKADGELDRQELGRLVFGDPAARAELEAIIHPMVYTAIREWFNKQRDERYERRKELPATRQFAIADIPLLYETGHADDFDRVVVAACTPEQQFERLRGRPGMTDTDARQRIAAQLPIADKARRADYVIDTSGSIAETDRQVVEVFERLRAEAGYRNLE